MDLKKIEAEFSFLSYIGKYRNEGIVLVNEEHERRISQKEAATLNKKYGNPGVIEAGTYRFYETAQHPDFDLIARFYERRWSDIGARFPGRMADFYQEELDNLNSFDPTVLKEYACQTSAMRSFLKNRIAEISGAHGTPGHAADKQKKATHAMTALFCSLVNSCKFLGFNIANYVGYEEFCSDVCTFFGLVYRDNVRQTYSHKPTMKNLVGLEKTILPIAKEKVPDEDFSVLLKEIEKKKAEISERSERGKKV